MPTLSTTNTPGGVTTKTSQYLGSGVNPMTDMLTQFAMRRLQMLQNARPIVAQAQAPALAAPRLSAPAPIATDSPRLEQNPSGDAALLEYMDRRRKIMDDIAAGEPAPMKFLPSGPGITGGYVTDPNAMNADQRKMFLPQGSSFAGGGGGGSAAGGGGSTTGGGTDPLADPYSDTYREMISRGMTPADIAMTRAQQQASKGR